VYEEIAFYRYSIPEGLDPIDVFLRLKHEDPDCFILESGDNENAAQNGVQSRWTFLGFRPKLQWAFQNHTISEVKTMQAEMLQLLERKAQKFLELVYTDSILQSEFPPFIGGLVGYFSYDYIKYQEPKLKKMLEKAQQNLSPDQDFHDQNLAFYDEVFVFDHFENKFWVFATTEGQVQENFEIATQGPKAVYEQLQVLSDPQAQFSEEEFVEIVQNVKRHIYDGDIFQAVVSNKVQFDASGSLFGLYQYLRKYNPSPYMFYLSSPSIDIAGAAPETLISVLDNDVDVNGADADKIVRTFPLAGTRRRGKNAAEDLALEEELLADPKERAEHNMLVDLGRNDIGKVAQLGSVEVEDYMNVHRFSHVMHIGSKVKGVLAPGVSPFEVVSSILPAGTLSGAPKLRAMEIIQEQEKDKRGIYGGCLGYIGFAGNMDLCITIRTAYLKDGKLWARAGAGIVYDSDPSAEYAETRSKMQAILDGIEVVAKKM
jgi:anthranilate synthase component 1